MASAELAAPSTGGAFGWEAEGGAERPLGSWRAVVRRFLAHRLGMSGLGALAALVVATFLCDWLWAYDHVDITEDISVAPSVDHPMGTDGLGRDLFAQVMRGTQTSLRVGLVVAALSTTLGAIIGGAAGFYGRWVDAGLMRLTDVVLAVPGIALLAVLARSVQDSSGNWIAIALVMALFSWTGIARVVRSITLQLRETQFAEAARATGASGSRVLFRHLLPHTTGVIVVKATLTVAGAVLAETSLSYLGLGISAPEVSLGRLVDAGEGAATTRPWLFYFPGLAILVMVLAVNFVGDGIRDSLDPQRARHLGADARTRSRFVRTGRRHGDDQVRH